MSSRLFGFGIRPATAEPGADMFSHQAIESTERTNADESTTPAHPARTRTDTIPSGVQVDATAAITPITASGTVLIADLPRRYIATAKRAMTTGPSPYRAPRAIGVTPSVA